MKALLVAIAVILLAIGASAAAVSYLRFSDIQMAFAKNGYPEPPGFSDCLMRGLSADILAHVDGLTPSIQQRLSPLRFHFGLSFISTAAALGTAFLLRKKEQK